MAKVNWAKELGIDVKNLERERPNHSRQRQIIRYYEERAARYEEYRRLIALERYAAAEALYQGDYAARTREWADYINAPLPDGMIAKNLERGKRG